MAMLSSLKIIIKKRKLYEQGYHLIFKKQMNNNFKSCNNPNYKGRNKIIYQDNIITKFLIESPKYGNFEILIDTEDWNKIKDSYWHIEFDNKSNNFYIKNTYYINKKIFSRSLHRVIINNNSKLARLNLIRHKFSNLINVAVLNY